MNVKEETGIRLKKVYRTQRLKKRGRRIPKQLRGRLVGSEVQREQEDIIHRKQVSGA
jgi:hypothetical protein